jgi:uncharacterized membrane protein
MALDSAAAKTWCITLVSAILIFIADNDKANYAFIAWVPTVFFFILDGYYLGLERRFRFAYNAFVKKLHEGKLELDDLYVVRPLGNPVESVWSAFTSFSIWPFYLTLFVMVYMAREYVLG